MKKLLVVTVLLTALFAAQNANGQEMIQQTNEHTFSLNQTEDLAQLVTTESSISKGTPIEFISTNDDIFSNSDYCQFGVGRYSGSVSIHYYNNCDENIKIGFKYQYKRCCPNCDCPWSSVTTDYAILSRRTSRQNYGTLKQGANQSITYHLIDYWKR
jgi:hypothetical protein